MATINLTPVPEDFLFEMGQIPRNLPAMKLLSFSRKKAGFVLMK